ncbi:MAG: nuclear transport factor 2 family protein [Candidatus Protistobacter heckmanni]|nr:nuclear transport factor 2 family protein [Candidatus Protistobacter heckmanni]
MTTNPPNGYRTAANAFNDFYAGLRREHLNGLGTLYAEDARFKVPFHHVHGCQAIREVLQDMFDAILDQVYEPLDVALEGRHAFVVWNFHYTMRRWNKTRHSIQGVSHLTFGEDGMIHEHCNYLNPTEELFRKLPLIGAIIQLLKSAMQMPPYRKY